MKRSVVGVLVATIALLLASGVAYAAAITCSGDEEVCYGTKGSDSIKGTDGEDDVRALDGNDSISGGGSRDRVRGGTGADTIFTGAGNDLMTGSAIRVNDSGLILSFTDRSNDRLVGGDGNDTFYAGFAQGGVDRVSGGSGDDNIYASGRVDRRFYKEIEVTKEVITCGDGYDYVQYDAGVDVVDRRTCENLAPVTAGERAASKSGITDNGLYSFDLE